MPPLNRDDSVLYFPPEAFGPFRVLHQIGAGTLGPVFRAHEPERGRLVAIKVFQLEIVPEQTAALVQTLDALVACGLSHPGIAAPIAAGIDGNAGNDGNDENGGNDGGVAYLAQEYAVGESLDVVMRERGTMPIATAAPIIDRLASAIDFAARRGVHHGLLHPRDIILGEDGPRITGFGVADALAGIGARLPVRRPYAASTSGARDVPASGERAPKRSLTSASEWGWGPTSTDEGRTSAADVFALAAITWELISGRRLAGDGADAVRSIGQLKTETGSDLGGLFATALSADPAARPSRARSFAVGLRKAAGLEAPGDEAAHASTLLPAEATLEMSTLERFAEVGAASDVPIDPPSHEASAFAEAQADRVDEPSSPRRIGILAVVGVLAAGILVGFLAGYGLRSASPGESAVGSREPRGRSTEQSRGESKAAEPFTEVELPASASSPPVAAPPAAVAPVPAPTPTPKAAPPPSPPPVTSGGLQVRTTPAGASVIVNGKARGRTPLTLRELPLGSYTIRLTRDGYVDEERRVQLTEGRASSSLAVTLKRAAAPGASGSGSLLVESRPPDAQVFLNSRLIGTTPLSMPEVPAGPTTVRIERNGYQPWVSTVEVMPGQRTRVAASLDTRR